jgi:hypothetical protein
VDVGLLWSLLQVRLPEQFWPGVELGGHVPALKAKVVHDMAFLTRRFSSALDALSQTCLSVCQLPIPIPETIWKCFKSHYWMELAETITLNTFTVVCNYFKYFKYLK